MDPGATVGHSDPDNLMRHQICVVCGSDATRTTGTRNAVQGVDVKRDVWTTRDSGTFGFISERTQTINHVTIIRPILIFAAALTATFFAFGGFAPGNAAYAAPDMAVGAQQDGGMERAGLRQENLDRMKALDASVIRFLLRFDRIAAKCDPRTKQVPANSPNNPCYDWSVPDAVVRDAGRRNIKVLFSVYGAPKWMFNKGPNYVGQSNAQYRQFTKVYGDFVTAAAQRYEGRTHDVPGVAYWTIWNEPNSTYFFSPQKIRKKNVSPRRYGQLYSVASKAIKSVNPYFAVAPGPTGSASRIKPITFVRGAMPVINRSGAPVDAWAHNPYLQEAVNPETQTRGWSSPSASTMKAPWVGIANLNDLANTLDRYSASRGAAIWITEFSYETNPDPNGVTFEQQSQWLAEAMHYAWANPRVSLFIWYGLFDDGDGGTKGFQSGLFTAFNSCRTSKWCAKPAAYMFRRPTWVSKNTVTAGESITVWGQSRTNPAETRLYIWEGNGWTAFNNTPDQFGSVYLTWTMRADAWFVTCDGSSCGAVQKVDVL